MYGQYGKSLTDSWNGAWVDYNNDGWDDLFITDKNDQSNNQLYRIMEIIPIQRITDTPLTNNNAQTVGSAWADVNNDGYMDVLIVNATQERSFPVPK